jgi:DNA-binding beta-propeller fold protein YncE
VFFPLPPAEPRVQFLTAINLAWDIVPKRSGFAGLVFGARADLKREEKVIRPHGIAVWQGKIYVCDKGAGHVKIFDVINGRFDILGGGLGYLQGPTAIAVGADGYKFVVESFRKRIHTFDPDDGYLTSFQLEEGRPADLVAVGSELFVADVELSRIQVLDRMTGEVVGVVGGKGAERGQFQMPNSIAVDDEGELYLSDQFNSRFQKLDPDGKPLLVVGKMGDVYGTFGRPRGIAVGPDGIIYVGDALFHHVQMFDREGQVLMVFGSSHPASGLKAPAAIAVDRSTLPHFSKYVDPRFEAEYLIFVTSMLGEQLVGVYAYGHLKPGVPVPALYSDQGPGGVPDP